MSCNIVFLKSSACLYSYFCKNVGIIRIFKYNLQVEYYSIFPVVNGCNNVCMYMNVVILQI